VRVLGPRPPHPDNRKVWDRGAEAISAYRLAYDVTDQDTVLGPEPDRGGFEQHRDWEQAATLALQARHRLGIDPAAVWAPQQSRPGGFPSSLQSLTVGEAAAGGSAYSRRCSDPSSAVEADF